MKLTNPFKHYHRKSPLVRKIEKRIKTSDKEWKQKQKRLANTGSTVDLRQGSPYKRAAARYLHNWGVAGYENVISLADYAKDKTEQNIDKVGKGVLAVGFATALYIAASTYIATKAIDRNGCVADPECSRKAIATALVGAEKPETIVERTGAVLSELEHKVEDAAGKVIDLVKGAQKHPTLLEKEIDINYQRFMQDKNSLTELVRAFNRIEKFDRYIQGAAKKYGLSENLLRALIATESEGRQYACSGSGACGLMQIMPQTAKGLGLKVHKTDAQRDERRSNPMKAVYKGAEYLAEQVKEFGSEELGLMAYNLGPTALRSIVKVHGRNPSIIMYYVRDETRDYPIKIYSRMKILEEMQMDATNMNIRSAIELVAKDAA